MKNVHLKLYIFLVLICASLASYAYTIEHDPAKIIEEQNREVIRQCIATASRKSISTEILSAMRNCNENLFSYIITARHTGSGKINSGTVAPAISGVPLGQYVRQNVHAEKLTNSSTSGLKVVERYIVQNVTKSEPKKFLEKNSTYWKAYDVAIAQLYKWEGLRLSAYWDHSGYSIGYGSRAISPTEKITHEEADRRMSSIVKQVLAHVIADFPNVSPEGQGALVSFAYNCHIGFVAVKSKGLSQHQYYCKTASGKRLEGLVARRAEESRMIFSK